jgi:hypothetical protein
MFIKFEHDEVTCYSTEIYISKKQSEELYSFSTQVRIIYSYRK